MTRGVLALFCGHVSRLRRLLLCEEKAKKLFDIRQCLPLHNFLMSPRCMIFLGGGVAPSLHNFLTHISRPYNNVCSTQQHMCWARHNNMHTKQRNGTGRACLRAALNMLKLFRYPQRQLMERTQRIQAHACTAPHHATHKRMQQGQWRGTRINPKRPRMDHHAAKRSMVPSRAKREHTPILHCVQYRSIQSASRLNATSPNL